MRWLTGLLAPLWRGLGADPVALHHILEAKLKIGARAANFMGQAQKKGTNYAWLIYAFLGMIGFGLIFIYFVLDDKATAIGVALTVAWIYLGFLLVTEMTTNIFDLRDLSILLSRPINDATFSLSRALYILVFATKYAVFMLVPLAVAVLIREGPLQSLLYSVMAIMLVIITVAFTLGFYLTMLKYVPSHRVKKVMGYVQVVLTGIFFMSFQLPNLMKMMDIEIGQFTLVGTWWGFATPGLWLGGLYEMLVVGNYGTLIIAQGVIGVAAVIGGTYYYLSQGEGYGEHLLAMQLAGSRPETDGEVSATPVRSNTFSDRVATLFTRPGVERASFRYNWAIMARDFKYKQQVYPGLVLLPLVVGFYLAYSLLTDSSRLAGTMGEATVLGLLYFFALLLVSPLSAARHSDQFAASWVLHANPIDQPGALFYGQLVAVIGQFFLPVGSFVYLLVIVVGGFDKIDDILLSAAVVLIAAAIFQQTERTLPFSKEYTDGKMSTLGPMLLVALFGSLAGLGHYVLTYIPYAVPVAAVVMWGVCWLVYRGMRE